MREQLSDRLRRLLLMVPFVIERGSVPVGELCDRFQVSKSQLVADLHLLFVCGLPSYGPGDLIEAEVIGDEVTIRTADYFSRPLRLTPPEGLMLYCGAKALLAAGGENEALERAVVRLGEALGGEVMTRLDVELQTTPELADVRKALTDRKRVHLVYHSPYKDSVTERDVDPWGLFSSQGKWYLVGWCHLVRDQRCFRVDRIRRIRLLQEDAEVPPDIDLTRFEAVYVPQDADARVTIDLAPAAAGWVGDYYPLESQEALPDGWVRIRLRAGGTAWLERLLVRLGGQARVVQPEDLKARVRELACTLAERYRPG